MMWTRMIPVNNSTKSCNKFRMYFSNLFPSLTKETGLKNFCSSLYLYRYLPFPKLFQKLICSAALKRLLFSVLCSIAVFCSQAQRKAAFNVIGFYTAKNDLAHISFVHEANRWFAAMAARHRFQYDSTQNWDNLNATFLSHYQVVIFLDTRPDAVDQRRAFEQYMEAGGAWMGFHFAAFALTPSAYPQNWDWYHNQFLGSGQYVSNTWRPTAAVLKVEGKKHPAVKHLPKIFKTAPNEWYRWQTDLRKNPDIKILASIDSSS